MTRRRETPVFNVSFLDVMFCGFGAVLLIVLILSGQVVKKRVEKVEDLQVEYDRVKAEYDRARALRDRHQRDSTAAKREVERLEREVMELQASIKEAAGNTDGLVQSMREKEDEIRKLEKAKIALESVQKLLKSRPADVRSAGSKPVEFTGDGQRLYLTGMKLGGERILFLVDASASMLDTSIVNIVRRKLGSAETRRGAPKWQRVVRSAHWLLANVRPSKQFQVYFFNAQAQPAIAGTDGQWLSTSDADRLRQSIDALRQVAPEKGTSLHNAFAVARRLSPLPDSIVLLTDGLPTQGLKPSGANTVSGEQRQKLFDAALAMLPADIPVNTLLFPIEGDPAAAEGFWRLAIATRGSFMTPASNWP